jgi:hypothetical protein
MMKTIPWRLIIGGILLLLGGFFLLQTLNIIPQTGDVAEMVVSVFFIAGGSIFLMVLSQNLNENWWAVIPGCVLLGIGFLIFSGTYFPAIANVWGGGMFLGSIALAFWVTYFLKPEQRWWAMIPAGTLTTLSLIAVDPISRWIPAEFLFFGGMSATFAMVALLAKPSGQFNWAWIPSGVMLMIALIVGMSSNNMRMVFPILLILGGGLVLALPYVRRFLKRGQNE